MSTRKGALHIGVQNCTPKHEIDVEGAELTVLRGATGLLSSSGKPRVIMAEMVNEYLARFGHTVVATCEFLSQFGYRPHALRGGTVVEVRPSDIDVENVYFKRQ